jgi:hypothetical protein
MPVTEYPCPCETYLESGALNRMTVLIAATECREPAEPAEPNSTFGTASK